MGQGFTFNRKGLSGIITVILIILISIIGISIIWLFVQPAIVDIIGSGGESGEIQKFPECLDNRLEVSGCGAMESGYYEVVVKRFGEGEISEIVFKFTTANDEFTIRNDTVPGAFGSAKYRFNLSSYTLETIESVEVAPILDVGACEFSSGKSCGGVITQEGFCGDGEINEGELCDGENLRELTCEDLDDSSGILSCNLDCTFNVTQCMDTGIRTDEDYLLDADVNVFLGSNGETFTVDYQGMRLRQNYSDETFYADRSGGNVVITYDIVRQIGGVDVVYTVRNPTQSPQRMPELKIDGILNTNNQGGNPEYYKAKNSAGFQIMDLASGRVNFIDSYYPSNYYSPVVIMRDKEFVSGSSIQYPYFDYKQNVMTTLSMNNNANSPRYKTWSHRYREFNDATLFESGPNAMVNPGEELTYKISLRFSEPRNWIFTLYPYKRYFESLYGRDSGNVNNRNLVPIRGVQIGDGLLVGPENPRGYRWITNQYGRIDIKGWGPFTDWFIQDTKDLGYRRIMIWLPSGAYENRSNNFPPQFMTQWAPNVSDTDGNFTKYAANGIELGFWWGNSNKVPVPNVWEPRTLVFSDYNNQSHKIFLTTEVVFAARRGTEFIGLDKFTQMPVYQRVLWLEDMRRIAPGVGFAHESPGPDLIHRRMSNIGAPSVFGNVPDVDLLAWYLNPSATIYIIGDGDYSNVEFLRNMTKWGYTPVPKDTNIAVSEFSRPLIGCNDGIDQREDGMMDYYDCGCLAGHSIETGSVSCLDRD